MKHLPPSKYVPTEKHRERQQVLISPSLDLLGTSVVPFLLQIVLKMKGIKYFRQPDPLLPLLPLKRPGP